MYSDVVTNTNRKMSKFTEMSLPEDVQIKDENISVSARSSPDSSTDPWSCPQCGMGNETESRLLEHLLHVHEIRVVPPQSPTKTRCPVCRLHVADLSQHFALEHGDQTTQSIYQETTRQQGLPSGASVTRIIPIVLPSLPANQAQNLLSEDSEAHLLESVVSKPGQQMRISDNYRSNGESTRSSTPNSEINNDNPVNLSMRREFQHPTHIVSEIIDQDQFMDNSSDSGSYMQAGTGSANSRKRRKQTHVPDTNKDDRYWARRLKNNEAAKKSRDMRIKREKVIFEENVRLENMIKDLKNDNDSYSTENKELQLKLEFVLDENARLKNMINDMERRN